MAQDLYSVEKVAELLGLHVKTVRGYVREGKLKAVRIGKQYRIAREDLEALTGRPAAALEPEPVRRYRHVEVSSIVEIDAISSTEANRLTNLLVGGAKGHGRDDQPLRIESIYSEQRGHLKLIVVGGIETVASFLQMIRFLLESQS